MNHNNKSIIKESMTNTQIVDAISKSGNIELAIAAKDVLLGIRGIKPDRHKAYMLIEQALLEKKNLHVHFVLGESGNGDPEHGDMIEMYVD